jgi:hypothetical protein
LRGYVKNLRLKPERQSVSELFYVYGRPVLDRHIEDKRLTHFLLAGPVNHAVPSGRKMPVDVAVGAAVGTGAAFHAPGIDYADAFGFAVPVKNPCGTEIGAGFIFALLAAEAGIS